VTQEKQPNTETVNWKQVSAFLGLTFGLTYLLDLILYLAGGLGQSAAATVLVQVQMLIPATVAIVLQMFVFKNSPIYRLQELPRWFFYFYLAFVLFYVAVAVGAWLVPNQLFQTIISLLAQLLMIVGLVLVIVLRLASGKEAFHRARLSGGKLWHYLLFGLLIILVLSVSAGLDALFGLGQVVDVKEFLAQAAGEQSAALDAIPDLALLLLIGAQTMILGPVLGLLIAFGEEYGWRGYLQGELIKMGKVRGILLVGVIWGLWHAPIIAMGYNYPGHPVLGVLLMTLMTVAWAFVLGYAVLKSQSVWLAAFLHVLLNQTASFLILMIYRPTDTVFSFTIGLYGLAVWAVVVGALFVLDRKQWITPVEPELVEAPN
jgi:membrane protease YdiL (CAAX protease family)